MQDPGYKNLWINHIAGASENRSDTNGTVYELFRARITSDIPPPLQLMTDHTGSSGTFFYKDYEFSNPYPAPGSRTSASRDIGGSEKPGAIIDAARQYLRNRAARTKTTPPAYNPQVPVTAAALKKFPNPLSDLNLRMTMTAMQEDNLANTVSDMRGNKMGQYTRSVKPGENALSLSLSWLTTGITRYMKAAGTMMISNRRYFSNLSFLVFLWAHLDYAGCFYNRLFLKDFSSSFYIFFRL